MLPWARAPRFGCARARQRCFAARVARIGIESDRVSEERRVWVKCEVCPPAFHLGEQAEVIITTGVLPEALLVPEMMVQGFDGRSGSVWVADKGVARRATRERSGSARSMAGSRSSTASRPGRDHHRAGQRTA